APIRVEKWRLVATSTSGPAVRKIFGGVAPMLSQSLNALDAPISRLLNDVRRRLVIQKVINCLAWAAGTIFAFIGLSQLFGLGSSTTLIGVGTVGLAGVGLILPVVQHVRRLPPSEVAKLIDGRLNS